MKAGRKEREGKKRFSLPVCFVLGACAAALAGGLIWWRASANKMEARQAAYIEQERKERVQAREERLAKEVAAADAQTAEAMGYSVESGVSVFEAVKKRPPQVELTEDNTEDFVAVEACVIDENADRLILEATAEGIPVSDDGYYYLFALQSYEEGLAEDRAWLAREYKDEKIRFHAEGRFSGGNNQLFQKFVVAVKKGEGYVAVSGPQYITNPEAVAKYHTDGAAPASKKGLLVDPNKLRTSELDDLGIEHAAYNIPVSRILGQTTSAIYPTIHYTYNGKTYAFNGQVMSEYDLVFGILTAKGIEVTAIILNDYSSAYPHLLHPLSRQGVGSAPYYAFNATDASGTEHLAAIGAFLAERYAGTSGSRGLVANWVIGNEINARKEWNYMEFVELSSYVRQYADAYRVFYNAIKGTNGAARVYISLDQQWNRNISSSKNYDSKDVLEEFNRQIKKEGNIDWGLAIHPYNVPLTTPYIWRSSKYVKASVDTPMVTMANIDVVTDYMQQEEFLTEDGQVRSITLSELGYTSLQGEQVQAAAIVYAYKVAEANQHIDSILFSRQTDAGVEIAQGLALGLNHANGTPKYSYQVFKHMDTAEQEKHTDFAKSVIGISSWSEVIKAR